MVTYLHFYRIRVRNQLHLCLLKKWEWSAKNILKSTQGPHWRPPSRCCGCTSQLVIVHRPSSWFFFRSIILQLPAVPNLFPLGLLIQFLVNQFTDTPQRCECASVSVVTRQSWHVDDSSFMITMAVKAAIACAGSHGPRSFT